MKRRQFISLLGGAAVVPIAARAQQPAQPKRVGVLSEYEAEFRERYALFRDRLAQLGWAEPRNLRIDYRWVDAKPELREARAREIVSLAPDVIFTQGPSAEAVRRLTRTIPIVFSTATDPVAAGYVQSFSHPGGNMTGFVGFEASINSKWLQLLKDVAPNVTRVAVLRFGSIAPARSDFQTAEAAARAIAVTPVDALVKDDAADISRVIAAFARDPNGGLVVPPGNTPYKHRDLIVMLADRHRLPAIYDYREFAEAGGLMSYGANRSDNYRGAAEYVDRILRGAKPADLPVQAPTKFELVINLKTAKALGLTVSSAMQLLADEVIE
jgi:putative tryptophan/tyrosine transport system substrate-binding protein